MSKSKKRHFKKYSIVKNGVEITLNLDRFNKQFQDAQTELDKAVWTSMKPFLPLNTGSLVQRTQAINDSWAGTGKVCAAAGPYGRFQYMGKVMVDPETNSPWARKGAKKIVTGKPLTYSQPGVVPEWFEEAKRRDGKQWIEKVKETAGGGS